MRDDLLEAQACIEWTISRVASLGQRIEEWLGINVDIAIEDLHNPATHNPIVAVEKSPFTLAFNLEFGAYINTLRSSLDILACIIGKREMVLYPERIYFPVADSAAEFATGNYRGKKF